MAPEIMSADSRGAFACYNKRVYSWSVGCGTFFLLTLQEVFALADGVQWSLLEEDASEDGKQQMLLHSNWPTGSPKRSAMDPAVDFCRKMLPEDPKD